MPASSSRRSTDGLEDVVGYVFSRPQLLAKALTHRTYSHEHPGEAPLFNERLEFLGDSVLGLLISEELFRRLPDLDEGELSKIKASLVRDVTLASVGEGIKIGRYMRLGKGEERTGGRKKQSVLAAGIEALIAAIYLDGGLESARAAVIRLFDREIQGAIDTGGAYDHKTELQELSHREFGRQPEYRLIEESGPDHEKMFRTAACINGEIVGEGAGRNKKEAEQAAAQDALGRLAAKRAEQV